MINNLTLFKKEFDIHLKNFLNKKIKQIISYTKDTHIVDYVNHANEIALNGGKRIRPFIAYLSYFAFGGKDEDRIIKFLVSLETFHLFALIHDDIMDKDKLRHGVSTSHLYISNELKKRGNKDHDHLGISQAILVGDLFFNWAWEIISLNSKTNVRKLFSEMVDGTAVGQMLDVDSKNNNVSKDLIYEINPAPFFKEFYSHITDPKMLKRCWINYLKTARYSFMYPLLIGASLSKNLTFNEKKLCNKLGLNLGIAFQAQDDIFDSDNKLDIEFQKEIIRNNIENAKKLIEKSKMKKEYKEKFTEFIETIEKRKF